MTPPPAAAAPPVQVTFLGGLGQIGRNCAAIEVDGDVLLVDCGQMFGDETTPGVQTILPDFTYLRSPDRRVIGCICTHGHEDHIGALPYLLSELSFPIYGTAFTLGLVRHKLAEANVLDRAQLITVSDNEKRRIGPFECEFLPVTHSTPSGFITVIRTPQGVILHSGDLKIDPSPVDGRTTNLARIEEVARAEGVRLLLADSTNADQPGETRSETYIGGVLRDIMHGAVGRRVIVASFASHIHRMQQVADIAVAQDRIVVPVGLSMVRNIKLARDLGLFHVPDSHIIDAEQLLDVEPARTCILCTGSQGEPRSALWQMVTGESRFVKLGDEDLVVFSSHPIPGNEAAVARLRNGLARLGVEVIHSGQLEVHTSGHARQGELAVFHRAASPEWFIPVHGEHAHLAAHAKLARDLGMPPERVLVCLEGDSVILDEHGLTRGDPVPAEEIYVDGTVGGVDGEVLLQRRLLGQGGFVAVVVTVDFDDRRIVDGPVVTSRGWATDRDRDALHELVARIVHDALVLALGDPEVSREGIERIVRRAAGATVNDRTKRRPMIVPLVRFC
ncbi:MAG TPA: ribonuclease J [Acidimicrobiales bacterium]